MVYYHPDNIFRNDNMWVDSIDNLAPIGTRITNDMIIFVVIKIVIVV